MYSEGLSFKDNLKELRKEANLTQAEFAQQLGVSKGIISLWESGKREPTLSSLILISHFFNISIDSLVGND